MAQSNAKYGGSWPTMVTPFDAAGRIDLSAYREMIEWYIERGVGGLYTNCLSGEMYWLDDEERVLLASEAVAASGGRTPIAATGNLGETTEAHLSLCRRIADTGVDIVMLLVPPFLNSDEEMADYFLGLADKVDAPLGLYECPVPRRYHLGTDLVRTLAESGRFVAFKETSEDLDKILTLLRVTKDTPLSVLQACNSYLLESVRAGGLGTMSIAAIHLPELVGAVVEKGRAGDPAAERLEEALCAMHLAQRAVHPQGTKYLLRKRGVPIDVRLRRPDGNLKAEAFRALDYAARDWFTADGGLRVMEG
ncbi:MAG: dihydrodipicolinate synthase family protein [Chloroflexi bacterium]|nr:dihydrodipicolinate synthase family protein [Chloroflexota bacterium]